MKKVLLFILASLLGMTQDAWAAKTPQVIWCQDLLNSTLYFINSETVYPEGGTYNGQRITRVWGEEVLKPSSDSYQNYYPSLVPWYDYAGTGGCTKVVFDESFSEVRPTTCYRWFYKFSYLDTIEGIENLNTSEVTNMAGMFEECNSFDFRSLDLSTLNTSKVKNFDFMFFNCEYLTDLNLSNFDTSNVSQMSNMFNGCERLTTLDLSSFDTKNVTDMDFMFANCTKLQTILVSRKWTVENVEDNKSQKMFNTCVDLVGGAGTKYVTYLFDDPQNCESKKYAHIDGGVSDPGYLTLKTETPQVIWCESNTTLYFINSETLYAAGDTYDGQTVSKVWSGTDVTASPIGAYPDFNEYACDYCTRVVFDESFASVRPTSCDYWFDWYYNLTTIEGLENLNTSEVTSMRSMFSTCAALTSLDLSNFNTANVTNMDYMFSGCNKLETIYVSDSWSVDNVIATASSRTPGQNMFNVCYKLVGGQGTTYNDSNPKDKTYAHIDGGESNPGYLSLKADEIALDETSSGNSDIISEYNGKSCNVTLARSIVPGSYNTLSLPFDVDNVLLKEKFGEDVELAELSGTHMDNETLYFDFAPADAITAGVPYLIYVSNAVGSPITFNDVTVKEGTQPVTTSLADFIPVFDVTTLDNGNENILFLGANNTLYYPSATSGDMKGFRAYFEVKGEAQGAKAMVMMDNSLTGVKTILNENLQNEQVYDLQGRMVTRPAKGLYIMNGKKVIIK